LPPAEASGLRVGVVVDTTSDLELTRTVTVLDKRRYCVTRVDGYRLRKALVDFRAGKEVSQVSYLGAAKALDEEETLRYQSIAHVRKAVSDSECSGNPSWYGGIESLDEALALFDRWDAGAKRLIDFTDKLSVPHVESVVTRYRYRRSGPGQLRAGNIARWKFDRAYRRKQPTRARAQGTIEIVIPWGGNCNVTSEAMFWKAAAGMAVAKTLRSAGYRVGLTSVSVAAASMRGRKDLPGHQYSVKVIRLVEPGQHVSPETIAASVAHAGIYRTAGFVVGCSDLPVDLGQEDSYWGLGQSTFEDQWKIHVARLSQTGMCPKPDIRVGFSDNLNGAEKEATEAIEQALSGRLGTHG
jgi:hypothetical protein